MLSLEESLKILRETNALLEGHFILSSGLHSPKYIQCAQLMSKPELASKICSSLSEKIQDELEEIDLILSPAMGGILVGFEIGRLLKKETVLIVEDVITTGKSSLECEELVLANKGIIVGYACIIDRSNGKSSIKNKIVSQIKLDIPTYSEKDIPDDLSAIKAVKPGSRNL